MSPKRSSVQSPQSTPATESSTEPSTGGDALLLVTWQPAAPVPDHLSDEATALLDESLRRIVSAALPDGADVRSNGSRHVVAVLPASTPTAAARAGRRARRAWKARWNAPVHLSAAAVRGGAGALALAEEALTVATRRRTGSVVLVDAACSRAASTLVPAVPAPSVTVGAAA